MFRLIAATLMLLASSFAAAQPIDPVRLNGYADGLMRQAMEQNKLAGATIAVVQDGRVILTKGYGTARIKPKVQSADADTLFQIASISKTPVYLAIMQLSERGMLKIDDPANAHLPKSLAIPDQGYAKPITIRHLMTHSAGFEDTALGHLFVEKPERLMSLQTYLAKYRPNRINAPGVQTSYSNYALALLGAIIANKSGVDFPTYMETNILRPLGMLRASYRDPYTEAIRKQLGLPAPMDATVAANMTQQLGGEPGKWKELGPELTTMIAPAGGMRASANDMAAYALALSDPARLEAAGVIKATTLAQMLDPKTGLPGMVRLGFIPYYFQGGRSGFGHGGAMAFGASDFVIVPDLKLGVFVSTNGRGGFAFANDFVRRMLKDFAPLPEQPPVRTAETKAMAKSLAGAWILNRRTWKGTEAALTLFNSAITVSADKDGDLTIGDLTGSSQRFVPMGNGVWQSPERYSRRIVAKDAEGRLTLWGGNGTNAALRASWWQDARIVAAILLLTLVFATVAAVRTGWRLIAGDKGSPFERYAARSIGAASLAWAIGIGGVFTVLLSAIPTEGADLLFSWPGPMRWLAWIIALAVLLTVVAIPGFDIWRRAGEWSRWRRIKHSALLILFAVAAFVCWTMGLVGYSGY
jgi:CubicO group peptidase (beta-lactamase class C family)